ncbi:septum formation initiator family protein [Sinobaca sp. H24]|uniref:FtsB family cell division protein n=1 Tax=Sinobaca sp. H24 TaxID=2923376 RepID=UPI00207A2071|nr:septum formation initiator family protein [Sinobaca sp. H24]
MGSNSRKVTEINKSYVRQQEREQQLQDAIQSKRKKGLRRRLTAMAVTGSIIAVVLAVILITQWQTLHAKETERTNLEKQYTEMQAEEEQLRQDIENYHDLDYIAEVARSDYYFTKQNETLYKMPDESAE